MCVSGELKEDSMIRNTIQQAVYEITETCQREDVFITSAESLHLPNRGAIIGIIKTLRRIIFPGYFGDENISSAMPDYFLGNAITEVYEALREQSEKAFAYRDLRDVRPEEAKEKKREIEAGSARICEEFISRLPHIQKMLLLDVEAALNGDPAAKSKEDIIFSYPGLFAIFIYRIAHELYIRDVPMIPRIMTEYAHSRTGIDINSGARIGRYFCIDHGTGIVVGETTQIGDYVKLYQGVTLGALSTRKGRQLIGVRRHPTIEDHVTIYANSTILGGDTVIGRHSVIGGNSFITESIPPYTRVSYQPPELTMNDAGSSAGSLWD